MSRHTFFNAVVREARIHTDQRMVLVVLQGEGAQQNGTYQRRRKLWTIKPWTVQPLTEGDVAFAKLKGGVDRTQQPMKARASWISQ